VCEHFTPRACYELVLDTILPDLTTYEELIGTNTVQGVNTSEYCEACEAEFEREYEERQGP
jgi:hypothetical protein